MYELLFLALLFLLFWFLMIRPAQRRQKAQVELQNSLRVGDEVMLTSGVFGVLREVGDSERVRVELAPGTVVEVVRAAVAVVVKDEDVEDAAALPADAVDPTPETTVDLDKRADGA
ncbi:preprotein translocase subunit YajC [Nocardioides sp. ChNu-99]|uniref:preprotein translocase subunit YajC n=1 Tax=Nocardioides sp. ChNu-99 TaxID=2839897 RepID=UPI002404A965|nr:preprotein translocase subunit YajC [Nocardioides sp. ChNu-99]MDF9715353.1 preprotein translocase subunit YajC [Nocardioides sp. ChNu-99]